MQRVRIGLTGLAFVFLAVLLAAIFTGRTADEAPITANSIAHEQAGGGAAGANVAEPQSTEPLAELGVAPGNADANSSAPSPAGPAANGR
jgi:hypothetical protein